MTARLSVSSTVTIASRQRRRRSTTRGHSNPRGSSLGTASSIATPAIVPPVLRLISLALPADFPYHPNWRTTETHSAFWEVGATVDHFVPRCLGGSSDDSNLVTTSMARNSAKMNWSCEQLGWAVFPPGDMSTWDGLLGWFMTSIAAQPGLLMVKGSGIRQWHRAAGQLWPGP